MVIDPAFAAALVVAVHFAFILFAVFGGLPALRWHRLALLHLPALAWAGGIMIVGGICPLTPIENGFREAAQHPGYAGGFIDHYIMPLIYPPGLDRGTQLACAAVLLAFNAALYRRIWSTRRDRKKAS